MAANGKIFNRLQFDTEKYNVVTLEWFLPLSIHESIENYALRFSKKITEPNAIIIGVSFGGVLAQEIAKIINLKKIIIIASVKHQQEIPFYLKLIARLKLYHIIPYQVIFKAEKLFLSYITQKQQKKIKTYQYYLSYRHSLHLKWILKNLGIWKNTQNCYNTIHIHGDKDQLLPIKNIQNNHTITNGTHAIVLTKPHSIQQILSSLL